MPRYWKASYGVVVTTSSGALRARYRTASGSSAFWTKSRSPLASCSVRITVSGTTRNSIAASVTSPPCQPSWLSSRIDASSSCATRYGPQPTIEPASTRSRAASSAGSTPTEAASRTVASGPASRTSTRRRPSASTAATDGIAARLGEPVRGSSTER